MKGVRDKYDFFSQKDKHQSFLQAGTIAFTIGRYAQSTQNSKFVISSQYL